MIGFINLVVETLGFPFITLMTLVFNMGVVIFMATNFRLGLIMMFITNAMLFLWAYTMTWDYSLVLTLTFLSVGLLTLTFWSNNNFKGGMI